MILSRPGRLLRRGYLNNNSSGGCRVQTSYRLPGERNSNGAARRDHTMFQYVYRPEADVENFEGYRPSGFHPTCIGDTFAGGRYRVIHKLGYGGYSTVWLAQDGLKNRYVALKIITTVGSTTSSEPWILRHLQNGDTTHPGRDLVPSLLDQFSFRGPNGHHLCLVTEPVGCSIAESKENSPNFMFPLDTAKSIAAQTIAGLAYMHSKGICHGDLHSGNILLHTPNLDALTVEEVYERFGEPFKVPIVRVDGGSLGLEAPSHAIIPMNLIVPANKVANPKIQICDLGTSFLADEAASAKLRTPPMLLPPEAFFEENITPAADVWTLALTLYEILGERPLFEVWADDPDDIIGEMVSTLGRLPPRWWDSWEKRKEFFLDDGTWNPKFARIQTPVFRRLRRRLWDMGRGESAETCEFQVEQGEMQSLEDFLRALLAYEPSDRMTAEEALRSEYMKRWLGPAWQRDD